MPNPHVRKWIRGGDIPTLNFSPTLATFTPSMAKRTTTVFNASPIIQGIKDGTYPDVLSATYGSLIAGLWYTNFDPYQGSFVQRWIPEYSSSGIATNLHYFLYVSSTYYFAYDYSNARYELKIGNQTLTTASAVTAGTAINLCVSWDTKNKIDGTNYVRISINDAHTFGVTTAPTAAAPGSVMYIGSTGTAGAVSAILEGITVYRRCLWDGSYGVNAGNGDEINLISAGIDPTIITGSQDVCVCLPTNGTGGALVTGAGDAWSPSYNSNVITPADGFMTNVTAWTNWTAIGSPASPDVLAAAEKIYQWGYKFTNDAAGEGYKIAVTVVAGADYSLRVLAHSDGTGQPQVVVYDETNGAAIVTLTGTTTSTRAAPNVLETSFEIPALCVSISIQLLNTVATNITYWHQAMLLTSLWSDGGFENDEACTDVGTPTTNARSNEQAHSGTYSRKIVADAADEGFSRTITVVSGKYYSVVGWVYAVTSGTVDLEITGGICQNGISTKKTSSGADAWKRLAMVVKATSTSLVVQATSNAAQTFYTDDISCRLIDDVTLTCTPASAANSLEGTGYRVDGYDTLTQPVTKLKATKGRIRFRWTPRHSAADFVKFGTAITPFRWFESATSRVYLYTSVANRVYLYVATNGQAEVANYWDCTGLIVAGTTYLFEIIYTPTTVKVKVDGVVKITFTGTVLFSAGLLTTAPSFGCNGTSTQSDLVISPP